MHTKLDVYNFVVISTDR